MGPGVGLERSLLSAVFVARDCSGYSLAVRSDLPIPVPCLWPPSLLVVSEFVLVGLPVSLWLLVPKGLLILWGLGGDARGGFPGLSCLVIAGLDTPDGGAIPYVWWDGVHDHVVYPILGVVDVLSLGPHVTAEHLQYVPGHGLAYWLHHTMRRVLVPCLAHCPGS